MNFTHTIINKTINFKICSEPHWVQKLKDKVKQYFNILKKQKIVDLKIDNKFLDIFDIN